MNWKKLSTLLYSITIILLALLLVFPPQRSSAQQSEKGPKKSLPNLFPFVDPNGIVATYTTDPSGQIDLTGPFFQVLGTNDRSCGTCHQPSNAWAVSAAHVRARFERNENGV